MQGRGWGWGVEWCSRFEQKIRKGTKLGGKINILSKKFDFLHSTEFKLLS
jgi:hypothetical protein